MQSLQRKATGKRPARRLISDKFCTIKSRLEKTTSLLGSPVVESINNATSRVLSEKTDIVQKKRVARKIMKTSNVKK